MKINLLGKTQKEIQLVIIELGLPKYTAGQITDWIYKKHVYAFSEMSNISLKNREALNEHCEIKQVPFIKVSQSKDGTKKYLFPVGEDRYIEAAYIPEKERATLCVSSQAGCKMGCLFCMTARQGFQGNLDAGEIMNQIISIPERDKLTNVVYMGMGEPFDNYDNVLKSLEILTSSYGFGWSPKRITVSTIGIVPGIQSFLEDSNCHLAVSLHSPFEEERRKLMPVENKYSINDVLDAIRDFDFGRQRRISFEYIVFAGVNDSPRHIKELSRKLQGINCRVNLLNYHELPESDLKTAPEKTMLWFRDQLNAKGITATIRTSRGTDIEAACGLLSTKQLKA